MNRKSKILIVVSVAVIVMCAAALLIFRQTTLGHQQSGAVQAGELPLSDDVETLQGYMDGNIAFRLNKNVSFAAPKKAGSIMLENPADNAYALQFSFYILGKIDSDPIYVSPLLPPGHYINGDALKKKLKSGSYACAYIVQAFDENDPETVVAEHVGELTVTVGSYR